MVERRSAEGEIQARETGIGPGLDHLVDEAAQAVGFRARRRAADIDLQFLLTQRRERRGRILIVGALNRHAVELITEIGVVAAADVDRLIPSALTGADLDARNRSEPGVRLRQRSAAAERCRGRLLRSRNGVHVGDGAGPHDVGRGARRNAPDGLQGLACGDVHGRALVREHRDATLRKRVVALLFDRHGIRVGVEGEEVVVSSAVGVDRRCL